MRDHAGNFELSDYVAANVNQLHYNMFKWACEEMKTQITDMDAQLDELDREHSTNNPNVIREYLASNDEEKLMMEVSPFDRQKEQLCLLILMITNHQTVLKNLRTNAQLIAREKWYNWRQAIVSQCLSGNASLLQQLKGVSKSFWPHIAVRS